MTTKNNTNHQIIKMKTEVNRLKIAKEALSGSTRLFFKKVSNIIGKYILLLIEKHFPNNHEYQKIFNKKN